MSLDTATPFAPTLTAPEEASGTRLAAKAAALIELTKPRIAVMVLFTVAVGFLLGSRGASNPVVLAITLAGTGLVAAGASAWNQVLERQRDALMRRTRNRPLPSGRVTALEAAAFGTALGAGGLGLLALGTHSLAIWVALATFVLYVALYTPLKPVTTLNTAIGAIPGALPPVIGWTAATGRLGIEAFALFLIVFLWQFPHFLAIAWLYRDDYARGGHSMLPSFDPSGRMTARQAVAYALALLPAGLLPASIGLAGRVYFLGALACGLYYLVASVRFLRNVEDTTARKLLRASILYLPVILFLLLLNPMPF